MRKVLWYRFQQCLGAFTILFFEASCETRLFRHLSDHDFGVGNFGNTKALRVLFFLKAFKISDRFQKCTKNSEKVFSFWDNCIWIGIVKLSLWRTRYLSLAANVLTCSPRICHVIKQNLFQLNFLGSDRWIWSRCCDAEFNSGWARAPCCLAKGPLKRDFLHIYLFTFSESVISEIQKLWLSSFYSKCSKFNIASQNAAKIEKKFFVLR